MFKDIIINPYSYIKSLSPNLNEIWIYTYYMKKPFAIWLKSIQLTKQKHISFCLEKVLFDKIPSRNYSIQSHAIKIYRNIVLKKLKIQSNLKTILHLHVN